MIDLVWGGIMLFSPLVVCVLFLAWKLVHVRDKLDSAERHTALIDDEKRSARAECSALHDQLNRAKNTPWVRCVGCKQMVEEREASMAKYRAELQALRIELESQHTDHIRQRMKDLTGAP